MAALIGGASTIIGPMAGAFFLTLPAADFDVMISNADGSGADLQLAEPGNQGVVIPTPGGVRLTYVRDVANIIHLYLIRTQDLRPAPRMPW